MSAASDLLTLLSLDGVSGVVPETVRQTVQELQTQGVDLRSIVRAVPAGSRPPRDQATVATIFAAGHGFTTNGSGVGSANLNDTSQFVKGTQSVSVTTAGNGSFANLDSAAVALDTTGKMIQLTLKLDDNVNVGSVNFFAANDSGFVNFWKWTLQQGAVNNNCLLTAGQWVTVKLHFGNAASTGAPTRAGVVKLRCQASDANGTPITVHWQAVEMVPESTRWPNGVVSFVFDDCWQSPYDLARPILDAQGYPASLATICDHVGRDATRLTLAEMRALQDISGWDAIGHAYYANNHDAILDTLPADVVFGDMLLTKDWLVRNGFEKGASHFAYPSGHYTAAIRNQAKALFNSARTIYSGASPNFINEVPNPADPWRARSMSAISSAGGGIPAASVTGQITKTNTGKGWLILTFHKMTSGAVTDTSTCSTTDFQTIVTAVAGSGCAVATVPDVLSA